MARYLAEYIADCRDVLFDADYTDTTITGTVTFAATTAITGSGTLFLSECKVGNKIHHSSDGDGHFTRIAKITSDTALTLSSAYAGTTGADTVDLTEYRPYDEDIWSYDELEENIATAERMLSQSIPYEQESVLPAVDGDKEVDISSLTGLVFVRDIEFYVDQYPKKLRNARRWGDYLTLDISFDPDVDEDTLTGTVTFAASTAVTGSGTDFDGEVDDGDYIKNSADTEWAKVRTVTDDTNIILARSYPGTTGADTVSLTPVRDYKEVVRIYWGGMHAIGTITTTIPLRLEQLIIDLTCGEAIEKMGQSQINKINIGGNVASQRIGLALAKAAEAKAFLRRNRTQRSFKDHPRGA